jgi:hypothetical protein
MCRTPPADILEHPQALQKCLKIFFRNVVLGRARCRKSGNADIMRSPERLSELGRIVAG